MSTTGTTECVDKHGNKFYAGDIGGLSLPPFDTIEDFPQHARNLREMEMNPGDVLITGFPKTGSHWLTSIIGMLMRGSTDNYVQNNLGIFLDRTPIKSDTIPSADKPRVFFTHVMFHHLPKQVKEKKVKLVYLERNPKDTWVSWYNFITKPKFYGGTWEHFFDHMLPTGFWYGDWFDYVVQWERDIEKEKAAGLPIFVNHFEDLKKDPVGQIEKLDQFLGYNRGRALCEQIAKACNFSTMKAAVIEQADSPALKAVQHVIYRKGEVGDWKNWFTVAQNERFDQMYNARMKASKLRYTYVLA